MILRGARTRLFRLFPLFYSYIIYIFAGSLGMYLIYWLDPRGYPPAYWIYYLLSILAEFTVLVEISDQIFRPFPAIRNLGRALTIAGSIVLGLIYILPAILSSAGRRPALFDFALRASVTKAIILVVLFQVARHYGAELGRNVSGLMIGFSIYLAMWAVTAGGAKVFGSTLFSDRLFGLWRPYRQRCLIWFGPYPCGNLHRRPTWAQFRLRTQAIPILWLWN